MRWGDVWMIGIAVFLSSLAWHIGIVLASWFEAFAQPWVDWVLERLVGTDETDDG